MEAKVVLLAAHNIREDAMRFCKPLERSLSGAHTALVGMDQQRQALVAPPQLRGRAVTANIEHFVKVRRLKHTRHRADGSLVLKHDFK